VISKNRLVKTLFFVAIILLCGVAARPKIGSAESGITVTPALVRLLVSGTKTSDTGAVGIKNNLSEPVRMTAQLTDVDTQNGTLVPIDSAPSSVLKNIKASLTDFTLQPNQSINIQLTATSAGLSQGGHYASLLVSRVPDKPTSKTQSINQAVSVGIFLVNQDGLLHKIEPNFKLPGGLKLSAPLSHDLEFKNTGNVETQIFGFVSINRGNIVYGKQAFNDASSPIFPSKLARYSPTIKAQRYMWPGKYTFTVSYRYDGQQDATIVQSTFWYVPFWTITAFVILVLAIIKISDIKKFLTNKFKKSYATNTVGFAKPMPKSVSKTKKVLQTVRTNSFTNNAIKMASVPKSKKLKSTRRKRAKRSTMAAQNTTMDVSRPKKPVK